MIRQFANWIATRDQRANAALNLSIQREILAAELRDAKRRHDPTKSKWRELREIRNQELRNGLGR